MYYVKHSGKLFLDRFSAGSCCRRSLGGRFVSLQKIFVREYIDFHGNHDFRKGMR